MIATRRAKQGHQIKWIVVVWVCGEKEHGASH